MMKRPSWIACGLLGVGILAAWWMSGRGAEWALAESTETGEALPTASRKRDPFIPLVRDGRLLSVASKTPRVSDVPLSLSGILWDTGGQSIALINETELRVGDTIHEYRITEIREDAVVLIRDGQSVVLQISFDEPRPKPGRKTP